MTAKTATFTAVIDITERIDARDDAKKSAMKADNAPIPGTAMLGTVIGRPDVQRVWLNREIRNETAARRMANPRRILPVLPSDGALTSHIW